MGPHRSPKTYSFHLPFLRALLPLSLCILSPLPITHAQGEEKTVAITPRTYSDNASGAQNQNTPVGADTLTPGCQSAPYKGSRVCTCPQPFGSAAWAKKTCQDGAGKLWAAGTKRCSKASDAVYTCVPPRGWTRGGTLSGQNICISLNAVGRGTSMCPYYGTVKIESRTPVPPSPPTPQPPPAPVPPPPAPVPPKPTTTVQPPPPPPAPTPPPTPAPVPPPYNPPTPTKSKKPKFVAGGAEVTNLLQPQPTGLGIAVPADPPGDEGPPSVLHGNISRLVVPRKLLFVLTNVNELGNTGVPTGWYLPEIARPYYYFQTAGVQMTFASPSGGNTWIDPLSIVWFAREKQCGRLLGDKEALQKMNNTVSLDDVNPEEYDAVFYAGGNGVMWDVATSPRLAEITRVIYEKGGIVSAVCHGSAGLAMVTLSNGEFLVKGKTLTGLSNNEEAISGMSGVVPFLLEDTLEEVGANYKWRPAWETHVEIDESGRLITGQNYASSSETAIWVISALRTLPDPPGFDARTQGQGSSVTEALGDVPKGFEIQLPKEPPGDEVPPSVSLKNMARLEVPRRLLFVVTNHKELGNTGGTTGWYLPEIARPYYYFLQAGINMTVASPQGGDTPIDPLSLLWFANRDLNARFMADEEAKKLFQNTVPLSRINPNEYDAVFYAGGNGVMWDVATDPRLAQFSKVIYEKGGVIGAVCHGSAGLALIKLSNGEYLVKNRKVTGLTNNEETIASMNKVMPFLLEDKLKEIGANFIWRPEWTTHVEVSGRVISGQNYASSTETAIAIIGALRTLPDPPGFNPATQSQGSSVTDKLDNVPQGFAVELPKDPPGDEAPPTMPLDQVPKLTIPRNLLFVVTGWEDLGKTGGKTGWYLPEIARPYYHFEKAGINLTIASVPGGKTPVDPLSVIWFEREERCGRFLRDPVAMRRMNNTVPLSRINPLDYDGIFYAGGNGVMWDVAINTRLPTIAKTIYERGGVVSSVCHGSAALALIKLSNGEYLVKGKEVTGLTNNEETIPGMQRVVPFLLEDKLKSVGADFNWKPEWVTHVEVSDYGRVISGQNYASSTETAVQVIKAFQSLPKVR